MVSNKISLILFLFFTIISNKSIINCENEDCFRAAVYQHMPLGNLTSEEPFDIAKRNLDIFEKIAAKASKAGAKILVFPEDAIINTRYPRTKIAEITEQIPDPLKGKHNPCENANEYKSRPKTYRLSCLAKTNGLYIVGHYGDRIECDITSDHNCPNDGHYLFNTAVAFSPDGSIVAKYHKMQLFYEFYYNVPPKAEFAYFDTPFGRIGLFICFDIIFKNPGIGLINEYGVQTMAFPLWWFDELPFKSAKATQEGWALNNRVNLLAANMQYPGSGSMGSGIYSGSNGALIYSDNSVDKTQLLIADIPIDSRNTNAKCLRNRFNQTIPIDSLVDSSQYKPFASMDSKGSALLKLKAKQNSIDLCNNGFCCQLDYEVENENSLKAESYWLMVANISAQGLGQKRYPVCEEFCGVFRCDDDSCRTFPTESKQTIFQSLKMSAKFSTNYTYPSSTTNGLNLVPKSHLKYESDGKIGNEVKLSLNDFKEPILSMSILGRCYKRDPPYKQ